MNVSSTDANIVQSPISREHAQIVCQQEQYLIRDLGSTNGTWVNSIDIANDINRGERGEFHKLENGAMINFALGSGEKMGVICTFYSPGSTILQAQAHDLVVDRRSHQVFECGYEIKVTEIQFKLLSRLYETRPFPCSFENLLNAGWDELQPANIKFEKDRLREHIKAL